MRILFAPDKFKGSLGAGEATAIMARGWRASWPEAETGPHPLADGGDGSLDVLEAALGGEWRETPARDASGVSQTVCRRTPTGVRIIAVIVPDQIWCRSCAAERWPLESEGSADE